VTFKKKKRATEIPEAEDQPINDYAVLAWTSYSSKSNVHAAETQTSRGVKTENNVPIGTRICYFVACAGETREPPSRDRRMDADSFSLRACLPERSMDPSLRARLPASVADAARSTYADCRHALSLCMCMCP